MACTDDDPVAPRPVGNYTAQVSGELTRSMQGTAKMVIENIGIGGPRVAGHARRFVQPNNSECVPSRTNVNVCAAGRGSHMRSRSLSM
jgi:hypothetical protein